MSYRLSVSLPERLRWGLEALAERSGKTEDEIVRDALIAAGVAVPSSPEGRAEVRRRAAEFREQQSKPTDTAALARESRREPEPREPSPAGDRPCTAPHEPLRRSRVTPGFQAPPG